MYIYAWMLPWMGMEWDVHYIQYTTNVNMCMQLIALHWNRSLH